MKKMNSLFNWTIIRNNLKMYGWIGILAYGAMFFMVPLIHIFAIIISVLTAQAIFGYMYDRKYIDIIHSLPIKREKVFLNNFISGAIILVVPILLLGVTLVIKENIIMPMYSSIDYNIYFLTNDDILYWVMHTAISSIIIYTISVFAAVITSNKINQFLLSYIIMFVPVGLYICIVHIINTFSFGYPEIMTPDTSVAIPIVKAVVSRYTDFEFCLYILAIIAIYTLAGWLYKQRKSESSNKIFVLPWIESINKYVVTFFVMVILEGLLQFDNINQISKSEVIIKYLVISALTYFVVEVFTKKGVGILKSYKGYLVYVGVLGGIIFTLNFAYSKEVPKTDDIKEIRISFYNNFDTDDNYLKNIENKDLKDKILNMHKAAIVAKEDEGRNIYINYSLNNGRKMVRMYNLGIKYDQLYSEIDEYMMKKALNIEDKDVNEIQVNILGLSFPQDVTHSYSITKRSDIQNAVKRIRDYINDHSFEKKIFYSVEGERRDNVVVVMNDGQKIYLFGPKMKKLQHDIEPYETIDDVEIE